ncbi:MAG: hypothetical protein GX574_05940, partial [Lentisphaerae bacterium]|nr:hypothetical protein [Lentisphaerota bacterium]
MIREFSPIAKNGDCLLKTGNINHAILSSPSTANRNREALGMKSRLKKLLRHVFYWDSPAQGAFFGLTLAIVGAWLLLSLFHFLWTLGAFGWIWLPMWEDYITAPLVTFGGAAAILLVYSLFLTLRSYALFWRRRLQAWVRLLFFLCFVALAAKVISIAPELITGEVQLPFGNIIFICFLIFCWILPLLLLPEIGWRLWLGHALCWSLGLLVCDVVRSNLNNTLEHLIGFPKLPEFFKLFSLSIQEVLHLRGAGWVWLLVAGLFL